MCDESYLLNFVRPFFGNGLVEQSFPVPDVTDHRFNTGATSS